MDDFSNGDQLQRLPLRALVAFASRCARRVQSLYVLSEDHPTAQSCTVAVDTAIRVAEEFAMGGAVDVKKARAAEQDVMEAVAAAHEDEEAAEGAANAANAAYAAINAAATAFVVEETPAAVEEFWSAIEIAGSATISAMPDETAAARALAGDLEILATLALGQFPELGEMIDPMEDGPLGPLTPPEKRKRKKRTKRAETQRAAVATKSVATKSVVTKSVAKKPATRKPVAKKPDSALDRTQQALARIDALQTELGEDAPARTSKPKRKSASSTRGATSKAIQGSAADDGTVAELQSRLQQELERVLAAKSALDEERKLLQSERESLESRLKTPGKNRGTLQVSDADFRKLKKERQALQAERESLEEAIQQLGSREKKLQQSTRKLNKERQQLESDHEALEAAQDQLSEVRERLEIQQRKLREQGEKAAAAHVDLQALREKAETFQTGLQQLEADQEMLEVEIESLQQHIENFDPQPGASVLEDERRTLQEMQEQLRDKAQFFQENEAALAKAMEQFSREREEFEQKRSQLDEHFAQLESEKQEFSDKRNRFQDLMEVTFRR